MAVQNNFRLAPDERNLLAEIVEASLSIKKRSQFFLWTQGILQSMLPHEIMICGIAENNRPGIRMHFFSIDSSFDDKAFEAMCNPQGGLIPYMLSYWQNGLYPCLVVTDPPAARIDPVLIAMLRTNGLKNIVAHGLRGTDGKVKGFFSFMKLPVSPSDHTAYLLEVLTPYLYATLARMLAEEVKHAGMTATPPSIITIREIEILKLVKEGKTTEDIAVFLELSPFTIKNHIRKILAKLAVRNRSHAVARAISLGIINQE